MNVDDLAGPVLASVSRSFYLTICLLPQVLRGPIGLAYLLARASDTIADTPGVAPAVRLRHLAAFGEMIASGSQSGLNELQQDIQPAHAGEAELLAKLERCLAWLAALPSEDRRDVVSVLEKIIRGQTLDLQRFSGSGQIIALPSAAALDEYTYLVAGCVGEFWTQLCLRRLPRYSRIEPGELCRLGIAFGKGLQLVNILRDAPADLRDGRCYLPEDELRAAGLTPAAMAEDPAAIRQVYDHWLRIADGHLADGARYLAALRPARLRAGCFLPWYLGVKTLRLLKQEPALQSARKVKVPRSTVRLALLLAIPAALSNQALERVRRRVSSS